MLAPLAAVLLFLAAIVSAFWYLRLEEIDREQEAVKRDVEYAQQRVRLRLLERQEQLMRIARDISNRRSTPTEFTSRAESHGDPVPRAAGADLDRRAPPHQGQLCRAQRASPRSCASAGEVLRAGETESIYSLARDLQQPVYSQPVGRHRQHRPAAAAHAAGRPGPVRAA